MHVVVARSRLESLAALLACPVFVVASLAIIAQGSALTLIVGTVGLATFASFGIGWITLLFRAGPGLVVDGAGFDDRSSLTAVGRVPWADVTQLSELSISGTSFVVVGVQDAAAYSARLRGLPRLAAAANRRFFGSPVILGSVGLRIGFVDLSLLLREGHRRYLEP